MCQINEKWPKNMNFFPYLASFLAEAHKDSSGGVLQNKSKLSPMTFDQGQLNIKLHLLYIPSVVKTLVPFTASISSPKDLNVMGYALYYSLSTYQ